MLRLLIFKDGQRVAEHILTPGEFVIGRSPENDIVLDDKQVSRRHARLIVQEGVIRLEDLGSVNRLMVDDRETETAELVPGRSATIRPFVLSLEAQEQEERTVLMHGGGLQEDDDRTRVMSAPPRPAPPVTPSGGRDGKPGGRPSGPASGPKRDGSRRPLLYGLLGLVVLGLVATFLFSGGEDASQPSETARPEQPLQDRDLDQLQRVVTVNLIKGKQALESGHLEEAEDHLRRVVVAAPDHEEAGLLLDQTRTLLETRRTEQERLQQRRLVLDQEVSRLLAEGQVAMLEEDYVRGLIFAQAALSLRMDSDAARELLYAADTAFQEEMETVRELESVGAEVLARGQELLDRGERVEAVLAWEEILELDPEARTGYALQASELAGQVKDELREQSSRLLLTARERARTDPRQAYDGLQALLKIDPWNEEADQFALELRQRLVVEGRKAFDEGLVLESLGEKNKACAKWRQALRIVPELDELHQRIQERAASCQ